MENNPQIIVPFEEEIPTPKVKIGDRCFPSNPDYMTKCVGTVRRVVWQPLTKGSHKWVWRVFLKLDHPFHAFRHDLTFIARCDTELVKEESLCH